MRSRRLRYSCYLFMAAVLLVCSVSVAQQGVARQDNGATIHGVVRDVEGKPAPGVMVRAFPVQGEGQAEARFPVQSAATTDSHGRYALRSLPEGRYLVRAGSSQRRTRDARYLLFDPFGVVDFSRLNRVLGLERYAVEFPTFHGQVLRCGDAVAVPVAPGLSTVADIKLMQHEVFSLSGTVRAPTRWKWLLPVLEPIGDKAEGRPRQLCGYVRERPLRNGAGIEFTFECRDLPAGEYQVVLLHCRYGDQRAFATPIAVSRYVMSFPLIDVTDRDYLWDTNCREDRWPDEVQLPCAMYSERENSDTVRYYLRNIERASKSDRR